MLHKIQTELLKIRKKFITALPVILFFFVIFYGTVFFFGLHYVLLVPVLTVLFKINFRKKLTVFKIAVLMLTQLLLAFLAFLATLNLPLCILLNLLVPFLLVFLQTSQFNQLGYFASAMTFTFLQMKPTDLEGFVRQMGVLACGMGILTVILLVNSYRRREVQDYHTEKNSFVTLAKAIRQIPVHGKEDELIKELFAVQQDLYKEAYQSRGVTYMVTGEGKIKYMFALLFQRAVNFLTDPWQQEALTEEERTFLGKLSEYIERAADLGFGHSELAEEGEKLFEMIRDREENVHSFAQNFLRLFLLILKNMEQIEEKRPQYDWKMPENQHFPKKIFHHIKMDTFELRFALRLSAVLVIGFLYNMQSRETHGYWLILNAFFLIRPMYEDSTYRLKSRLLGTVLGCVLLSLIIPLMGGTTSHFLLASVMVIGMYMEMPGTWTQAFFSTCYALTLTTLAMPQAAAMEMRLIYIVAAVVIVLIINKFFFPTSLGSQFQYNFQMLFHIQHTYLRMIEESLMQRLDYGTICDVQIQYHLVYDQIIQYLKKQKEHVDASYYKSLLAISLRMVSAVDQMLYLVNSRKYSTSEQQQLQEYLEFTACILNEIQQMLEVKPEKLKSQLQIPRYKRTMEEEPQLSAVMERYSKLISQLFTIVCRHGKKRQA